MTCAAGLESSGCDVGCFTGRDDVSDDAQAWKHDEYVPGSDVFDCAGEFGFEFESGSEFLAACSIAQQRTEE